MVDTCAFWFEGKSLALIHSKGVNTLLLLKLRYNDQYLCKIFGVLRLTWYLSFFVTAALVGLVKCERYKKVR